MASCQRNWSQTICDLTTPLRVNVGSSIGIVPADGKTTGRRIRINRPVDENAKCKVSRALGQHAAHNTLNVIINVQRHLISASTHRANRASAMQIWREVVAAT